MRFEIVHQTECKYSRPVFLEPHVLRLRPRSDWSQRLESFELEISPEPAGCARLVDLDGNDTAQPWFSEKHEHLRITAHSQVETLRDDPFGYLLGSDAECLPMLYGAQHSQLEPYLMQGAIHVSVTEHDGRSKAAQLVS